MPEARTNSFGQIRPPSVVDRFGVWLSSRQTRRHVRTFRNLHIGDFGCGYEASFVRRVLPDVAAATIVDVALSPDLARDPKVTAIEGALPDALVQVPSESLDVVLVLSVLEHLWEPIVALQHCRRILKPGGICLVNVPSWRGKSALEFAAFRLHVSPVAEMNDHKAYYDPRDLWPLLVRVGFLPSDIRCFRHKFGLNTFAVCRTGHP